MKAFRYLAGGIPKCRCCGFSDIRALQIDHIHGGGRKEVKEIGVYAIYLKILDMSIEEARKEYQVLCANCNRIKETEKIKKQHPTLFVDNFVSSREDSPRMAFPVGS